MEEAQMTPEESATVRQIVVGMKKCGQEGVMLLTLLTAARPLPANPLA